MRYVFDLDGTLADVQHRIHHIEKKPKDWDSFSEACDQDKPIFPMIQTLLMLANWKNWVEIWTGRSEIVREKTLIWLKDTAGVTISKYGECGYHKVAKLRMRPKQDHSPDNDLKRKWLYEDKAAGGDRIDLVFEDRMRVVDMWRSENIMCCQVDYGNF